MKSVTKQTKDSFNIRDKKEEDIAKKIRENEERDLIGSTPIEYDNPNLGKNNGGNQQGGDWKDNEFPSYSNVIESDLDLGTGTNINGANSIFNKFAVFAYHKGNTINNIKDYTDTSGGNKFFGVETELSAKALVKKYNDKDYPSNPYYYSDFAFSKYWELIPENRLITVRRYPYPVYDNLTFPKKDKVEQRVRPLAQAITYFGNPTNNKLESLLKIKGEIAWKELVAEFKNVQGNEQGFQDSPIKGGTFGSAILKGASVLAGKGDASQKRARELEFAKNYNWENRVRGDVNVIKKTHIRDNGISAGVGEYSITFDYELRSYNGINPKIALLDLITNFLALAYQEGKFWGGDRRYFPNSPKYPFLGNQNAFYEGRYGDYMQSVMGDIKSAGGTLGDTFGGIINGLMNGDLSSIMDGFKKIGNAGMSVLSGKNRPQIVGFKALLSGEHIGEYHMTVGNPNNPIAMIGNLIATSWEFRLSEEIGVNDFPTGISFTLNLKDAMPRTTSGIQSIFNGGNGRMYLRPKDFEAFAKNTNQKLEEIDIKRASGTIY